MYIFFMKRSPLLLAILLISILSGCQEASKPDAQSDQPVSVDRSYGRVEIFDPSATQLVDTNAVVELLASGFVWSEGPVWVPSKQMLLFSDVPENKIYQWKEGDSARVFLFPSGYTDTAARAGENGANGLTLDKNGSLLLCQSGNRHVSRLSASLDKPIAVFNILSRGYKGKKFNSPNDLVTDRAGNIYFTDPIYGLPKHENDPTRELKFEGVYKIDTAGKTSLLIDSIARPNGVALSPDESILYIGSSDSEKPRWYAYKLNDRRQVQSGGILLDAIPLKEKADVKQGPDGLKIDNAGNLYSSGPDGINILSPTGKRLALIRVNDRPTSNCAFNETKTVLFITADDMVFRVKLK